MQCKRVDFYSIIVPRNDSGDYGKSSCSQKIWSQVKLSTVNAQKLKWVGKWARKGTLGLATEKAVELV